VSVTESVTVSGSGVATNRRIRYTPAAENPLGIRKCFGRSSIHPVCSQLELVLYERQVPHPARATGMIFITFIILTI
jgi:hypothetical protein